MELGPAELLLMLNKKISGRRSVGDDNIGVESLSDEKCNVDGEITAAELSVANKK
jgi:hypothetical protein